MSWLSKGLYDAFGLSFTGSARDKEKKKAASQARGYSDIDLELMEGSDLGAGWDKNHWRSESAGYDSALGEARAQREQDYGGVFQMFGEEDLFTKITGGMREATQRDTYQPFFEMQRGGAEGSLLAGMSKVGTAGFEGSGGEQSMMDALQGQYAQASVGFQQQAVQQQQQAQQALDDIVRANQQQSLQLRQMELA